MGPIAKNAAVSTPGVPVIRKYSTAFGETKLVLIFSPSKGGKQHLLARVGVSRPKRGERERIRLNRIPARKAYREGSGGFYPRNHAEGSLNIGGGGEREKSDLLKKNRKSQGRDMSKGTSSKTRRSG